MSNYDIFPVNVLAVLGALEDKTTDEMVQSLLNQEEEIANGKAKDA